MKQLLFTKGPQGPIGATLGTAMNNFCSSSNKVSTHYITWLFSFWIWRRRCLKFAWFWPFGALPLGPHGGHTYYLNNFESPTPKDDSCQVWLKSNHAFSRRRWKCKKFTDDGRRTDARRTTHDGRRTTDDARRTTDDGRKRTAIAHSSLRLRWAKNNNRLCSTSPPCSHIPICRLTVHVCTPGPRCIKVLPAFFTAKFKKIRQKKCFHCNLHRDLPEFFYGKKKVWQKVLCNGAQKWSLECSPGSWEGALWVQDWYWILWPG